MFHTRVREEVRSSILDPLIGPKHTLSDTLHGNFIAVHSVVRHIIHLSGRAEIIEKLLRTLMNYMGKCDLYYQSD